MAQYLQVNRSRIPIGCRFMINAEDVPRLTKSAKRSDHVGYRRDDDCVTGSPGSSRAS